MKVFFRLILGVISPMFKMKLSLKTYCKKVFVGFIQRYAKSHQDQQRRLHSHNEQQLKAQSSFISRNSDVNNSTGERNNNTGGNNPILPLNEMPNKERRPQVNVEPQLQNNKTGKMNNICIKEG